MAQLPARAPVCLVILAGLRLPILSPWQLRRNLARPLGLAGVSPAAGHLQLGAGQSAPSACVTGGLSSLIAPLCKGCPWRHLDSQASFSSREGDVKSPGAPLLCRSALPRTPGAGPASGALGTQRGAGTLEFQDKHLHLSYEQPHHPQGCSVRDGCLCGGCCNSVLRWSKEDHG